MENLVRLGTHIRTELSKVIVGQREVIDQLLIVLVCGGHALLEGVPGLAKTLTVKTLARICGLGFQRVQCTADLMPADVIGTNVFNLATSSFSLHRGPIFTDLLLVDEINRTTARTQAALLEAMEERQVTVFGTTYLLEPPFLVLATQNPIELEGTYPLPEAQMDRFLFKVVIGAPKPDELREILNRTTGAMTYHPQSIFEPRHAPAKIEELKLLVREVMVAEPLERYIISIIGAVTPGGPGALPDVSQYLRFGPSPRGAQALILCAKVNALLDGRASVSYDDVNDAIVPSLRHRLLRNFQAEAENVAPESILEQALKRLKRSS